MEKITFEDYQKYGGTCDAGEFPVLLIDCETILDKCTFGRIHQYHLDDKAKRLIVKLIDTIITEDEVDSRVSSYSDGIESISYNNDETTIKAKTNRAYELCKQYLPNELIYRGI